MKKINIGLFGFGVVGEGIYTLLNESIQVQANVKSVCIKDATKQRNASSALFTTDHSVILDDADIDLVVELISDADAAYTIICTALNAGKSVVSANKKIIAEKLPELLELAQKNNVSFLYEAAVCASIPIIRNLEEYFDNDWLQGLKGIVNGSTNFILTQIRNYGMDYPTALKLAQEKGFAEADPSLDVEGFDASYKLCILAKHAYGVYVSPSTIFKVGITSISAFDAQYAKEKGFVIKLIAYANSDAKNQIDLLVAPTFVPLSTPIAAIDNEYNAVIVNSAFNTEHFFSGKGAGRFPTASAVLSDISAYTYNYQYEYKKSSKAVYTLSTEQVSDKWYISSDSVVLKELPLAQKEYFLSEGQSYIIVDATTSEIQKIKEQHPSISVIKFWK